MSRDHYAVLGVTPTSEDVVIRAAYRALMQRYHPDADPSSEASQKAQAINAAYAVLSDPEKRARYDGSLAAQGLIKPEPAHPDRRGSGPAIAVGLAAVAAVAAVIFVTPPSDVLPIEAPDAPAVADKPAERTVARKQPIRPPATATAETKAAVDDRLTRPGPTPVEDRGPVALTPAPAPRMPQIRAASASKSPAKPVEETPRRPSQIARASTPTTQAAANCRLGSGWAERTICSSTNLTALDRQLGLLYGQSLGKADEARRAVLLASRDRFRDRRSACRSESCLTSVYVTRLREISDIMARGSPQ